MSAHGPKTRNEIRAHLRAPSGRKGGRAASGRALTRAEAPMFIVPEAACPGLLSLDDAFPAVEAVFAAMARGDAYNFPVVRDAIGHEDAAAP